MTFATAGYWPGHWSCEDGGPRRWGAVDGDGLGIQPHERLEVAAVRDAFATDAVVWRDPGQLYALRHPIPLGGPQSAPVDTWVERLDPHTLGVSATSPRLPGGSWWPGGIAVHRSGDVHAVLGRWAHRLSPELDVLASHRLPESRPYNSFVVLDTGELVLKDCDAPAGRHPSTFSVLDPETLLEVCPPLRLPEPIVARLSSDGEQVIAVGSTRVFRLRYDPGRPGLTVDEAWAPRYGSEPDQSYGWDPVIAGGQVWWMDNGRNRVDRTMLGSGEASGPVRLWRAGLRDGVARGTEISGLPHGTVANPPAWDPERRIVVAYDAGNAVVRAWRLQGDELEPLWRRDGLAHAAHVLLYPRSRELVLGDWRDDPRLRAGWVRRPLARLGPMLGRSAAARRASLRWGHDDLVVLDLDTGAEKARVSVPSATQAFLFSAPGPGREVIYQSLTTLARVAIVPS